MAVRSRLLLLLLCGFCTPGASLAQDLAERLDAHMRQAAADDDFSGSVLVARGGDPILSAGYGLANREHGVPCTPQTKYRLGSITKQFTAAGALLLQQAGELDVRDSVELYLADVPEAWYEIRLHHLLSHQSGIWNVTRDPDYATWWMLPSRPQETMTRFRDKPLEFEPGSRFSYSNSGYVLLAAVIEEVSGEKWEDFMRAGVFDPLGMDDSGHDTFEAILPHRASGYTKQPLSGEVIQAPYHDMDMPIGGGDLYSTVEDMLVWDQALYTDELLSDESRAAMFTPNLSGYGYGFLIAKKNGRACISHGGGINGFVTQIDRYTEDRTTVIVLSNSMWSEPQALAGELAELLFAEDGN